MTNTQNSEQLKNKLEQIQGKLVGAETEEKRLEAFRQTIYQKEQEAIKELEEQLEQVRKPYIKDAKENDAQKKKVSDKKYAFQAEVVRLKNEVVIAVAQETGEHTIDSVKAFLSNLNTDYTHVANCVSQKKTLANGIQIFKGQEYEVSRDSWGSDGNAGSQIWLAFYKTKCIGFSVRQASEHAGDSTSGESFIGSFKPIEQEVQTKWGGVQKSNRIGFTDWKKKLETTNPSKVKEIDFTGKKIRISSGGCDITDVKEDK